MSKKKFSEKEETLIGTAVLFLSNQKVENEKEEIKMAFLKKKALSKEMIQEAFERYKNKKENQKLETKDEPEGGKKEDIESLIQKSHNTKFLSLRNRNITNVDNQLLEKLTHLEHLILNDNPINTISQSIKNLKNLKTLQLVNCGLQQNTLPIGFYELENLEELNLSKNHIFQISDFFKLPKLKKLICFDNEITNLDILAVNNATKLLILDIRKNNYHDGLDGLRKDIVVKIDS